MKVLHVPFGFRPDPVGGTEVYVEGLARAQMRRGVDVVVAAPGRESSAHTDNGLSVRRFAVSRAADLGRLYGLGDQIASTAFASILDQEQPDLVHLHAFTSAVSARLAQQTQQRGVPLVFTYHTPTVSCQRGTLLRWGRAPCDGTLDVHACAGCALHGLGRGPKTGPVLLGALPTGVGRLVGGLGLSGGLWTGLRMTNLVQTQHAALRAFMQAMDRVVVLCQWVRELLVRNGIPPEKLRMSRHGLPLSTDVAAANRPPNGGPVRIAFLGRLHPTKGVDLLIEAFAALPDAPLELHVFGIPSGDAPYAQSLRGFAAGDRRIAFCAPVASDRVQALLHGYDVVAVPSRWLETGPLVVLEAFAAGLPVIGSRLGGIRELVEDGVDGLLVEPLSVTAWAIALARLADDPRLLPTLRAGVRPPRRMEAVVDDMWTIYSELLQPG